MNECSREIYARVIFFVFDMDRQIRKNLPLRSSIVSRFLICLMVAVLMQFANLQAKPNFVYTNNDIDGPNTVSGFSVSADGQLTDIFGSPFLTGGIGFGGFLFASNRITMHTDGNFVYASNAVSNDVSVFKINKQTGVLTLVEGSPFAIDGTSDGAIALGVTPDGRFLMAANFGSNNITVFRIAKNGRLTQIKGSPFTTNSGPDGIRVSPNGKFLAVAEPNANQIEMFKINRRNGSITSLGVTPGQISVPGGGLAGVDIDSSNRLLYGGVANAVGTIVDGYLISRHGELSAIPGAPFEVGLGTQNSNVVLIGYLCGREKILFVSNQYSKTVTVFKVARNGRLTLVPGAPFAMNAGFRPSGMAARWDGKLLYVANLSNAISVFRVKKSGSLKEVSGSPFSTGQSGGLLSLTAFPPNTSKAVRDGCHLKKKCQ